MAAESVTLAYIDPPFNTGRVQRRKRVQTLSHKDGERTGFAGRKYKTEIAAGHDNAYSDSFSDFCGFLRPRLAEAKRILTANGSLFFHIDWRESHRCRLLLEDIFGGSAHCINEIIWTYDFGGRGKKRWPPKHDNIYWFAKDPKNYIFNYEAIDRIPYLAPGLAGGDKAARGKTPTDVWWNTIVPTSGHEKTGYPTQKPLAIAERIVRVHSHPGDVTLDFFAGSGTLGEAALKHGRKCILIDKNPDAIRIIRRRMAAFAPRKRAQAKKLKTGKS